MIGGELLKSLRARSDDRGLQSSDGVALEAREIGEIAHHASSSRGQARVGIEEQAEGLRLRCHGRPERRRRLRGSPGNSRDRRSKGGRCAGPCRWCSTFRNCSVLPASRIARNWSELAWGLSRKLYLTMGGCGKAKVRFDARVAHLLYRENGSLRLLAGFFDPLESAC
jgi:hypothetical protein